MHQLGQQQTVRIGVDPDNEDPQSSHNGDKAEGKKQPVLSMGCSTPQVINDWRMPQSPKHPKQDASTQSTLLYPHLGKSKTHPTDLLQHSWKNPKNDEEEI